MKVRFFNPGLGYQKLKPEISSEIDRVLTNGDLILRGDVEEFEKRVAEYIGTKYCVALNSCTDALYLALRALKIGPGDKVLVPSRTFVATAQVIIQVGATPVFYDLDASSEISIDHVKAIIPVHIEGKIETIKAVSMEALANFCKSKGIYIIEDAAQAFGAYEVLTGKWSYNEEGKGAKKMAGSFGDAGCFSFYPAKTLGAYGDAGALVTDNEEIYKYVRDCRNHFKDDARDWGVNSRLDNLQAAILNVKFDHYEDTLTLRKLVAEMYTAELKDLPITLPPHTEGRIWQDYIIRCNNEIERNALYAFLKEKGVETLKNNYPFPVPKTPLAQKYEDETLRLPCNELLTKEEVAYVISQIKEYYE